MCGYQCDRSGFCSVTHENEYNEITRNIKRMRDTDEARNARRKPEIDNKVWRLTKITR